MAVPKPMPIFAPVESGELDPLRVVAGFIVVVVFFVAVTLAFSASNVQLFDHDDAKLAIGRDATQVSLGPMDCMIGDDTSGPGA